MQKPILAVVVAAMLAWASFAWGDTLVLTNGQRIEGKIVFSDEQEIVIQLTDGDAAHPEHVARSTVAQMVNGPEPGVKASATAPTRPTSVPAPAPALLPWPANFPNVPRLRDPSAPVTAAQVDQAIRKAVEYLYSQEKDGNWEGQDGETYSQQEGGMTALVTYALLAAGEKPGDPRVEKAIKYLLNCKMTGIYAIGLRSQVWPLLPQPYKPEIRAAIDADGTALLKAARPDPGPALKAIQDRNAALRAGRNPGLLPKAAPPDNAPNKVVGGFYGYTTAGEAINLSTSQYGVLGMWGCVQAGYEVSNTYWEVVDSDWRAAQQADGGWKYGETSLASISMTSAGVATLFIAQEYLHGNDGIDCHGNIVDPNIEAGLKWIGDHFPVAGVSSGYEYYGFERIGAASGRKYFGTVDWYKEGARWLVLYQVPAGNWAAVSNSAYDLLFLVRGRAPVVMNKLQYDIDMHGDKPPFKEGHWNERPRDVANLTKWIGKQNEHFLNWQVVNLKAPAEDLHDAPILYIAGNQALDFTDEELDKLRRFVEEGGLILANADCGSKTFSDSVVKICHKLFPLYEFRTLPAQSPIYVSEQFRSKNEKHPLKVSALSNGVREMVILMDQGDPARFWQTQAVGGHEELHEFADNVFLYSIDRGVKGGLRNKGESYIVTADANIHAIATLKVARLQFAGNWDPEPGAWRRLAAVTHNQDALDLDVQNINLGEGKLDKSFPLADLTGTFKFTLTPAQRDEIKKYVQGGGLLIVDTAGGDAAFAQSAQDELAAIFPDVHLEADPLPLSDAIYSHGPKLEQVEYRPWAQKIVGKLNMPRIRALKINGRTAVLFSGEDLTCGLLGMQIDGVFGYDPASATALMEKIVLSVAPAQLWTVPAMPQPGPVARPRRGAHASMSLQDRQQIQQLQQKITTIREATMDPQAKQKAILEIQQQILAIARNQQQNP